MIESEFSYYTVTTKARDKESSWRMRIPWGTAEQLRVRWRQAAFQYHPDRGGDLKQFIELKTAYEEAKRILEGGHSIIFRYPG